MPGFPRLQEAYDFVIVGGGHAGLQAGLKAALLHFSAVVIDRGPKYSRSYYSPRMDNIPGFPEGISGHELLDRQITALRQHEDRVTYVTPARASAARRTESGFEVDFEWLKQPRKVRGKTLILAPGVVDRIPAVEGKIEPIFPWANQGLVLFCELCDGHDLPGKTVAILGATRFTVNLALELQHFGPASMEILTHGELFLGGEPAAERAELERQLRTAGIPWLESEIVKFEGIREKNFTVKFADGTTRTFDLGFSGLGWYDMHGDLPHQLGAAFDPDGYVQTDEDARVLSAETGSPIPGLYCVGDLRSGWNQIPEAWATAERAVIDVFARLA
ncbi:MAG: NAD(P)/FAD-dependent oxidoreductase [Thermoplasmata archaeon]|nr:NAD(P)/FAD-dependent oxidoreductase [Thermoplasmata archaeon]